MVGKTINEIRRSYGLEEVEGGDTIRINQIRICNERCKNYILVKYEKLTTNNICKGCISKESEKIKELMSLNKESESYSRQVEKVLNEV